jgi:hypothetical protein
VESATLAGLLGLDRAEFGNGRYAFTEIEEPEILLAVDAPGLGKMPDLARLRARFEAAGWLGCPSRIDPSPGYLWPIIDQAASASRTTAANSEEASTDPTGTGTGIFPALPPLTANTDAPDSGTARLIRQRQIGRAHV